MTKIIFMGTPDFSVPVLERLISDKYDVAAVVTQPDRPVGRKRVLTPPPVKAAAQKYNIPVYQPEKIKDPEELDKILNLNPDVIVTAAYGQILPKKLLEAPKFGCINVHASLLPELRGGAPIHYAILQGKEKTGITIMYMVEKLDAGDIISHVEVPILETDHVGSLHEKLSVAGADLLSETLPKLLKNEIIPIKQEESLATFASNIKRDQEKINWDRSGEEIYNQIRGLHPWPVAYTMMEGEVLKIWWGEKVSIKKKTPNLPGTIIDILKDGFVVSTANDIAIKITELQPSGKKKIYAESFLNGIDKAYLEGKILGD